jgi:PAS domain S-box-containing protein
MASVSNCEQILIRQKEITDRYKTILEHLSIGVAVINHSREIQSTNTPIKKILRYKKSNHKKKCHELFFNRQTICNNCAAEKTFSDGRIHTETITQIIAGKKRFLRFTTSPIYDSTGNVNQVIKQVEDVTEKTKIKNKLGKFSEELVQLNKSKDRFISILSHDLKQPFNTILGFSDILINSRHKLSPEKTDKYLKLINQSAQQTYRLLSELLFWAKSQSGKNEIQPETFLVIEICDSVMQNVASLAEGKSIEIHCLVAEKLYMYADINIFKIVLRNLLTNAIKYSHPNNDIYIYADIQNGMAVVTVSDSGVGMDEEEIPGIWDIHKKQSRPGTTNEKGSGFGLSLCKDLIQKHKGDIWVKSKKNQGSDFTFALPLLSKNEL